jgi:CheY-like chemotaxis protein
VGQQLAPAARAKGLQWSTRVEPAVPPLVLGDSLRLRQVLINLVGNAVKFTDSGSIEVQARLDPSLGDERPAMVSIAVSDTGIGLTPEQQGRLFKAFSQADASVARRYGGTGLGLSISRQIMQAMGGSLSMSSERGRGSTFVLSWPLQMVTGGLPDGQPDSVAMSWPLDDERTGGGGDRGSDMARQLVDAGRELAGRRVLVVDDNRMNVAVVRRLLERAGLQVTAASSGPEALKILTSTSVDIVLLDLYMPEMNGDEVARRIHGELGLQRLPVIALSASVTLEERERCAAAGMVEFVSKPIDPLELLSAMADCLQP